MSKHRIHRKRIEAGAGLAVLFAAGCCAALVLGTGVGSSMSYLAVTTKAKPTKAALGIATRTCTQLRQKVGAKSFTKTFKTAVGCRNILAPTAQVAIKSCKRYPAGSTAYTFCLGLVLEGSPAHKAAVAGLRIITDRTQTFIPIPGSGQGAGTGGGTGAGTGGGPAHH